MLKGHAQARFVVTCRQVISHRFWLLHAVPNDFPDVLEHIIIDFDHAKWKVGGVLLPLFETQKLSDQMLVADNMAIYKSDDSALLMMPIKPATSAEANPKSQAEDETVMV